MHSVANKRVANKIALGAAGRSKAVIREIVEGENLGNMCG